MKPEVVFSIFLIVLLTPNAQGSFSLDAIMELLSPRNPEVNRVRRIEDANGDPLAVLDTIGLVEQYGHLAEEHKITTEDGYNIVFFRLSGSPKSPPVKGKPAVFIQHGLFASSDSWVLTGPNQGLVYLLTDAGYDVWIGNIRGNTYCRSHVNLTTADKEFWDFSWHDIALQDISSMIDYVLEITGQKNLFYIGHSMGTTMSYVLLSEKPEYNSKMRLVVSLSPEGYWKYMPNIIFRLAAQYGGIIKNLLDSMDIYDLGPQTKMNNMLSESFCRDGMATQPLCLVGYSMIVGQPLKGANFTVLSDFVKYYPAGASTKTVVHFQQCLGKILQKYDYGSTENLRIYGTKKPPNYDFTKISAPVALFYGKTDELSLEQNVIPFSKMLPNVATVEAVPSRVFNHVDFIISPDAKDLLYNRIVELLSKY